MKNRLGVIKVSASLLNECEIAVFKGLFSEFYPVSIDRNKDPRSVYFYGYSERFDEIQEGSPIPYYNVIMTNISNVSGEVEYSVQYNRVWAGTLS